MPTPNNTPLIDRRRCGSQACEDVRHRVAVRDGFLSERQQVLLSLRIVVLVSLTVVFLRLDLPGPAYALLAVGFLLTCIIRRT